MGRKKQRSAFGQGNTQAGLKEKEDLATKRPAQPSCGEQACRPESARAGDFAEQAKYVEFVLEMPSAETVNVAGTFNNWDPKQHPLRKGKDGLWRAGVRVPAGRHEYRFVVDGTWMSDPKAAASQPNAFGTSNSVLEA